jgi:uncharacterized membrane protein YjgN (DUF898 family)
MTPTPANPNASTVSSPVQTPASQACSYPLRFTASGSEYLRIWIVNLLMMAITAGLYLPWARARKIKYFYNNTWLDDRAFEFHGEPLKMLRGTLIVGALALTYALAVDFGRYGALAGALILIAIWPMLFFSTQRFRMNITSFLCIAPPLACLLLPSVAFDFAMKSPEAKGQATKILGVYSAMVMLLFVAVVPYFYWRIRRFQHSHYAWAGLRSRFTTGPGRSFRVFAFTSGAVLSAAFLCGLLAAVAIGVWVALSGRGRGGGPPPAYVLFLIGMVFLITVNILPRAYFKVAMQNWVWRSTDGVQFRMQSSLKFWRFVGLQFKNYFLIMLTLGLYWPFAVIASKRMQLQAITLQTDISLRQLTDAAHQRSADAAGDLAADFFGMDVGI